jgi:HlyD family secretion protein
VLDGFKLRVSVDEHYIARIQVGQRAEFTFADQVYRLSISKIYPQVIEGRFEVDMVFDSAQPEGIKRGQTLHTRLELGGLSTAVLLARGGFYERTGGQWAYVVDASREFAVKRKVSLGRQNPEVYEVLGGLEVGERVITSSYETYGDNIDKLVLK